jgi:hypothetical protein
MPTVRTAQYLAANQSAQAHLLYHAAFSSEPVHAQRWRNFKLPDSPLGAPQSFAQWLIQLLRELPAEQNIKLNTLLKLYRDARGID